MEKDTLSLFVTGLKIASVGLVLSFLGGCVTEPSALTGKSTSFGYTWQQELELGQTSDQQIVQEMGLYANDALSDYVVEIGERVLAESDLRDADTPEIYSDLDFTFRVMDSSVVNAFALPGGYVYVTRGLLSHLNNEAQLAVVLGHEITHVAGRHASKQALKQQFGQIGLMASAVIGSELLDNEEVGNSIMLLGGDLFQLLTLKYGRDAERESDLFGVDYAASAGYDVAEAAKFFDSLKRISERSSSQIPSWMSSHPDPGERSQTIIDLANKKRDEGYDVSKKGTSEYYSMIDGLVVGDDPRHGFARDNYFFHPDLGFQFQKPSGWRLENQPTSVNMSDAQGRSIVVFSIASGTSAETAAQKFAIDSGGGVIADSRDRINGKSAFVVEISFAEKEEPTKAYCAFIEHSGSVFSFLGIAKASDYDGYRSTFAEIAGSFDSLNDRSAASVSAARLKIVVADRSATFSSFLPENLPSGIDALGLAIMNQVELDTVIEKGTKLKIPSY